MTEDKKHIKNFIVLFAVTLILVFSLLLFDDCIRKMWIESPKSKVGENVVLRVNIKDEVALGNLQTDELSWLHDTSPDEGKTVASSNDFTRNEEGFPRKWNMYPKEIEKRDLAFNIPSEIFEKKVELTTPKIQPPWLNDAASAMNVRVPRGLSKYRNPRRAKAINPKKHSNPGKSGFEDTYFLGPETSCRVPEGLQTIDVRCKMWPTYKRCFSYCVYGSTFDEGIQREHNCVYKENKWSKEFDECKPFVNCKVQLQSPGKVQCFDNEVSTQPNCEIYCEIYEDKDEMKAQAYHCNANATWTPHLPFCVQPREHVTLAKAPNVKEHTVFAYPGPYKPGTH